MTCQGAQVAELGFEPGPARLQSLDFLARVAAMPPLIQPSPLSEALMQSRPRPLLTSTWKCSCSHVTLPTVSRSRRGARLWPEPSNAARAPAVHSSSEAMNRTSEKGQTGAGVARPDTKAGEGATVARDALRPLTESAVPAAPSAGCHLEAKGCGQAGCLLAPPPAVSLNHADGWRGHVQ